jgi:alkyl sulfatase BDS1-like metallo-beta-lactamase superfamily hydrolase
VREIIDSSLEEEDFRWAIELSSWLVRSNLNAQGIADAGEPEDRKRLAAALRGVAYTTSAANIRNWCITRALELDESLNLSRFRKHRFNKRELSRRTPIDSLKLLRVLLVPEEADAYLQTLQFNFSDDVKIFYSIRNSVAVIDKKSEESLSITLSTDTWYDLLSMKKTLSEAEAEALVEMNNSKEIRKFFSCFDLESLNS